MTGATGAASAAVMAVVAIAASGAVSARTHPDAGVAVRVVAATAALAWLLVAAFEVLSPFAAFSFGSGLAVLAAALLAAGGSVRPALALISASFDRLQEADRTPDLRWPLRLVTAMGAVALARALLLPPLATDALTYHLVHAARYVVNGGRTPFLAPDAWGYYEYYPTGGDILWAWSMLPFHGDVLVGIATVAVWAWAGAATFALARELGHPRDLALYGAGVLALTPAVVAFAATAYTDTVVYAAWASGSLFLVRYRRGGRPADAALAVTALAVAGSTKLSGLLLLFAGVVVLAALAARARRWRDLSAMALVAPALPPYLRGAVEHGSPTWPFQLTLGRYVVFPGEPQNVAIQQGLLEPAAMDVAGVIREMFVITAMDWRVFLNLGPAFLVLGLATAFGLLRLGRADRVAGGWLAVTIALTVIPLFTPGFRGQLTIWFWVLGRLVLPAAGAALILGLSALPSRRAWLALLAVQALWSAPIGISAAEIPWLAAIIVGLVLLAWAGARGGSVVAVALCLPAFWAVAEVRGATRHHWYDLASRDPRFFLPHPLQPPVVASDLWRAVDDERRHRIAMTAGFAAWGHNWYQYPLLGSRLQNSVVYVPPTRGGEVVDYWRPDDIEGQLDLAAWARRLRESGVDLVFSGAPPPPEAAWLRTRADCFRLVGSQGENFLYAVNPSSLAACEQ